MAVKSNPVYYTTVPTLNLDGVEELEKIETQKRKPLSKNTWYEWYELANSIIRNGVNWTFWNQKITLRKLMKFVEVHCIF